MIVLVLRALGQYIGVITMLYYIQGGRLPFLLALLIGGIVFASIPARDI